MKHYASSVYSQKSTASAKSGRSFLSFTWSSKKMSTTIVPIQEDPIMTEIYKQSLWQNMKTWTTSKSSSEQQKSKKGDADSIATRSSSSSISKLKNMVFNYYKKSPSTTLQDSPRQSIDTTIEEEEYHIKSRNNSSGGILINCHDNMEAIAERKKKRSLHILKLQKQNRFHPGFKDNIQLLVDSSDTLLNDDEEQNFRKKSVAFSDQQEKDLFNPRIMFIEPSPVPRFRNVAPPPPPSPPYLDIIVYKDSEVHNIIQSPATDEDEPTVFTQFNDDEHDKQMCLLYESLKPKPINKPKLCFHSPLQRGQTIKFSLKNMIPEDHIILFKFLTTNNNTRGQPERYFVRPSAGKMTGDDQAEIMLFLNQVPNEPTKDKIIVRWAAVQRHTNIEDWVHALHETTRRKWVDMLDEAWPDQVTIRMTRIKIRFR